MYEVVVTEEAEQDTHLIYQWWRDHRSPEQAAKWFEKILTAFQSLQQIPERCQIAPEAQKTGRNIRQLLFTIGQRKTHRILFLVESQKVSILRVRHVAQESLPADFFEGDRYH